MASRRRRAGQGRVPGLGRLLSRAITAGAGFSAGRRSAGGGNPNNLMPQVLEQLKAIAASVQSIAQCGCNHGGQGGGDGSGGSVLKNALGTGIGVAVANAFGNRTQGASQAVAQTTAAASTTATQANNSAFEAASHVLRNSIYSMGGSSTVAAGVRTASNPFFRGAVTSNPASVALRNAISFLPSTVLPPALPPGGGAGGAAGAAGAAGGGAGGGLISRILGAAGPAGAAAAGVAAAAAAIANIIAGFKQIGAAVGAAATGIVHANPTEFIHAAVGVIQGWAKIALGPLVGPAIGQLLEPLNKFADFLDDAVANLRDYNGAVANAAASFDVASELFKVKLAAALEPALVAWLRVKMALLNLFEKLLPLINDLAIALASFLDNLTACIDALAKFTGILLGSLGILQQILSGNLSFAKLLPEIFKLIQAVTPSSQQGGLASGFDFLQGFGIHPKGTRPLFNQGFTFGSGPSDVFGPGGPGGVFQLQAPAKGGKGGGPSQKMADAASRASDKLDKLLGVSKTKLKPQPFPHPQVIDITQQVTFNLEQRIQHETAVESSIMQIRDKLVEAMMTARNESNLLCSMLSCTPSWLL